MAISDRKKDHLDLCATAEVGFRGATTLLEHVHLVHDALPELSLDELDLATPLCGKTLRAPLVIASMTGGTEEAGRVNLELAALAEERGLGFGLGSQRAMHKDPGARWTYRVREAAPTALVFGNLGAVQAARMTSAEVQSLVDHVDADALCLHLNPAMEIIQPGGDRDFRGCLDAIGRLVADLRVPVIVKETGSGLSPSVGRRVRDVGVRVVDVSGAGGTSWVGVETLRADPAERAVGQELWDWGIPTAVSVALMASLGLEVVATGGIQTGHDIARALSLGATAAGVARAALKAHRAGGREAAGVYLDGVLATLRAVMLLTGCRTPAALRTAPRVLTGPLRDWLEQTDFG